VRYWHRLRVFDNGDGPSDQIHFDDLDGPALGIGGQIGYDHLRGPVVLGVVGDATWVGNEDTGLGVPDGNTAGSGIGYIASLRVRLGYSIGEFLPYVTGGGAVIRVDAFIKDDGDPALSLNKTEFGYVLGSGVDWRAMTHLTIGAEVMFYQFDYFVDLDATGHPDTDAGDFSDFDNMTHFRLTVNYRF
jgi:opacity protein-like surface antigen